MNKYEKMKRKEEIKEILKKILHVVSYVLSVAFIVLMVIVGAQSCSSDKNNIVTKNKPLESRLNIQKAYDINLDEYAIYEPKWENLGYQNIDDLMTYYNIPTGLGGYSSNRNAWGPIQQDIYLYFNGVIHKVSAWDLTFAPYEFEENGDDYYYLSYFYFYFADGGGDSVLGARTNLLNDEVYSSRLQPLYFPNFSLIVSNEHIDYYAINYFFKPCERQDFIFNKQFNYNAPLDVSLDSAYSMSFAHTTESASTYALRRYYTGYFLSNGILFNQIVYTAKRATSNNTILIRDGESYYAVPEGAYVYDSLVYLNTDTNNQYVVNSRDIYNGYSDIFNLPFESYDSTTTWLNDAFRQITFLQDLREFDRVDIQAFNNNNQNSISGNLTGSGGITDVFTLVGSAFTSILPVLNIVVLPGITLGILMFIPIVAMLVFAIIRIIKK